MGGLIVVGDAVVAAVVCMDVVSVVCCSVYG